MNKRDPGLQKKTCWIRNTVRRLLSKKKEWQLSEQDHKSHLIISSGGQVAAAGALPGKENAAGPVGVLNAEHLLVGAHSGLVFITRQPSFLKI